MSKCGILADDVLILKKVLFSGAVKQGLPDDRLISGSP
jgi:hypothetical protein